ncbi:MAG TPA: DUF835 domain-containing protein [Candidatus Poseidoniales archaeon]|nr:MAG TPA: DUF835 domain-containing protein [Candidatus Poseidoniales archaeon]
MIILVELPQGVVIEVRRGGHDALAKLAGDMSTLGISGYIRIERRPKGIIPRVSQVIIQDSVPRIALHEADLLLTGLEALMEIEKDSTALDALVSLVELPVDELIKIVNLYPDATIQQEQETSSNNNDDWWNYVRLNTSSWRREERLPGQEVSIEAPEYIQQLTKAKLENFSAGERVLNYGDVLIVDDSDSHAIIELASILAGYGRPLLVLSRHDNEILLKNYSLPKESCHRVSMLADESPVDLIERLQQKVANFLWANKQAVVIISGFEYLLSITDLKSSIGMISSIVDEIRKGDHLMLANCDLEIFDNLERHRFLKEFDLITLVFLEALIIDSESLIDHPICIELSDEELSWIEQQISFATSNDPQVLNEGVVSGGASDLVDEDVLEVKGKLAEMVDDWSGQAVEEIPNLPSPESISTGYDLIEENFDQAFSATEQVYNEIEVASQNDTIVPVAQLDIVEQQSRSSSPQIKGPRKAIRIKRARKKITATRPSSSYKQSIAAAAKSQVNLPKFAQMSAAKSNRGAVNIDLDARSSRISSALENMLKNPIRAKSRELSQALNQKSTKTNHNLPDIEGKSSINVPLKSTGNSIVHPASKIAQSNNNRHSRESATRVQNKLDVDRNYQKWATEYKRTSEFSDGVDDYEIGGED